MSAAAQNYVYRVQSKKDAKKPEPVISKDRLEKIEESVGKYLDKKD